MKMAIIPSHATSNSMITSILKIYKIGDGCIQFSPKLIQNSEGNNTKNINMNINDTI